MHRKIYSQKSDYIYLIIGSICCGIAGAGFYTPAQITGGGATGIGTILFYVLGIDQGFTMLAINIPLILIGMKVFGWRYGIRTLIGSSMVSFLTTIIGMTRDYQGLLDTSEPINVLLSALFGGCLMGVGVGLSMRSGSNTGGTDIISQIVASKTPLAVGTVSLSVNAVVVACGGFIFGLQRMFFALIAMYCSSQLVNFVLMGIGTNMAKAVYIMTDSDRLPDISRNVIAKLHRGGTIFRGEGIFTLKEREMLLVIVPNNQLKPLLAIVKNADPDAFVFVTAAYEVLGKGFSPIRKAVREEN